MSVRACVHSYVFGCVCAYTHILNLTHTHTHTRTHTRTHTESPTHTHNQGSNQKGGEAYQQRWEACHGKSGPPKIGSTGTYFSINMDPHAMSMELLFR